MGRQIPKHTRVLKLPGIAIKTQDGGSPSEKTLEQAMPQQSVFNSVTLSEISGGQFHCIAGYCD